MKYLVRKTPRLVVRPLHLKDFTAWREAHLAMAKPKNIWDLGARSRRRLTLPQFRKILRSLSDRQKRDVFYDFGVFEKNGALVGHASVMEVARGISQTAFLGYSIYNGYWGKGYAKEAVRAVLDIGFRDLKLHRLEAGIEPGNKRSIGLAKALGMRREGLKKRALFLRKTWVDLLMYTLTCEELGIRFQERNLKWKRRI